MDVFGSTWTCEVHVKPRFYFLHDTADMAYLGLPGLGASLLATATRKNLSLILIIVTVHSCSRGSFS